jgi:formylglycine-generating enzyme required for sulfatase activity
MHKLVPLHQSFLQNVLFLAPEQKRLESFSDEKSDVYAFGLLTYFLLMNEFPEPCFTWPTSKRMDLSWNWDLVIAECLKSNPNERPESLEELLLRASGFASVEPAIVQIPVDSEVSEPLPTPKVEDREVQKPPLQQFDLFGISQSGTKKESNGIGFQTERVVKEYYPEKRETKNIQPLLTDMVVITGDHYFRGSNHGCRDEMPRHRVKLNSFALDIHPVTNEQFVCYLDVIGDEKDTQNHDIIRLKDSRIKRHSGRFIIEPGYAKHPVVGVTWYGAVAYAKWIGKRLPTEAEWEIACCGGLENPMYPTGETIEKSEANFFSSDTTAVMSYPPNEYGLFDLAGNVYEWCHDWYEYAFYEASAQEPDYPKGPLPGVYRVLEAAVGRV